MRTLFLMRIRMLSLLFFLFLWSVSCFGITLGDAFENARPGDFVVCAYQKHLTILIIKENNETSIAFEEISGPMNLINEYLGKWNTWIEKDAPQHTSWTISTMSKSTKEITSIYSKDAEEYLAVDSAISFLPTLLLLPFHSITPSERKHLGPPPMPGEPDFRKLWNPKIIYEGKEIYPPIVVERVFWPNDKSDLSGKAIDLYIPRQDAITYFPYWVEIAVAFGKVKIRVVDSGRNLTFSEK